jgi:hypothetical protein
MHSRKVQAALHGQIRDVNRKLQDSNNDKKKVETALRGKINYHLQNKTKQNKKSSM